MSDIKRSDPGINGGVVPVLTMSRRDGAMREIRRAIVLGSLRPGDKLTEVQLALSLNVSRPTLREALNQLAQEGFLTQEPYRGLRVAQVSLSEMRDIAQARVALDMQAMIAILADATGRRLQLVEAGWAEFERLAFDPDPVVQHDAHLAFHRSIWAASENYLLLKLWPVTEANITIALAQDLMARHDPDRAHHVHATLMDAIRTKDLEKIRPAFIAHTINSAEELVALLEKDGSNV